MFDEKLRASVLKTLGLEHATAEDQDIALLHVESTAYKRLARMVPELLTDEQLQHTETMRAAGKSDEEIFAWVQEQLPDYEQLMSGAIQDVAEEVAQHAA